jgi:hypothetical protein
MKYLICYEYGQNLQHFRYFTQRLVADPQVKYVLVRNVIGDFESPPLKNETVGQLDVSYVEKSWGQNIWPWLHDKFGHAFELIIHLSDEVLVPIMNTWSQVPWWHYFQPNQAWRGTEIYARRSSGGKLKWLDIDPLPESVFILPTHPLYANFLMRQLPLYDVLEPPEISQNYRRWRIDAYIAGYVILGLVFLVALVTALYLLWKKKWSRASGV